MTIQTLPHAPATAEELLRLFHGARAGKPCSVDAVLALVEGDPAFAFNVTQLLRGDGLIPAGTTPEQLRPGLEAMTPLRVVATLAAVDRDT